MFRRISAVLSVLGFAVLAVLSVGVSSAAAASDTGWVPVGRYPDLDIQACGTTLTIHDVVNRVEVRERTDDRGNVRTDFRGVYIVRVSAPDGRQVVLNNSGPYSIVDFANGDTLITVRPPALVFAFDEAEADAFEAAGLPEVFYYTEGRLDLVIHNGVERVITKPADPVSICELLR